MRAGLMLIIAVAGCSQSPQEKARQAADAYMKVRGLASEGAASQEVIIKDEGPDWLVIYHVPEGHVGGDLMVWVDKRTMKPVAFLGWQ